MSIFQIVLMATASGSSKIANESGGVGQERKRYSYTLSKYNKPIHELPEMSEINSPEIDVSYAGLRAMSYFFANYCDKERGVS